MTSLLPRQNRIKGGVRKTNRKKKPEHQVILRFMTTTTTETATCFSHDRFHENRESAGYEHYTRKSDTKARDEETLCYLILIHLRNKKVLPVKCTRGKSGHIMCGVYRRRA